MTKYRAVKTVVDGIEFASKKEAARYGQLKLLAKQNEIQNLELQPKFPIFINGKRVFEYRADFAYFDGKRRVVEDVKGYKTQVYKLKAKAAEAYYNIQIMEI